MDEESGSVSVVEGGSLPVMHPGEDTPVVAPSPPSVDMGKFFFDKVYNLVNHEDLHEVLILQHERFSLFLPFPLFVSLFSIFVIGVASKA